MFTSSWQVTDSESTLLRLVLQEGEPGLPLPTGHLLSCRAWQGHPRAAPSPRAQRQERSEVSRATQEWGGNVHMECGASHHDGEGTTSRGPAFPVWEGKDVSFGTYRGHVKSPPSSRLSATPWTLARQAPLSTVFCRREYWSGLPCPPPGDLPNPGIETASLKSPALAGRFFTTSATWEIERAAGLKAICGVRSQRAACSGGGIQK